MRGGAARGAGISVRIGGIPLGASPTRRTESQHAMVRQGRTLSRYPLEEGLSEGDFSLRRCTTPLNPPFVRGEAKHVPGTHGSRVLLCRRDEAIMRWLCLVGRTA